MCITWAVVVRPIDFYLFIRWSASFLRLSGAFIRLRGTFFGATFFNSIRFCVISLGFSFSFSWSSSSISSSTSVPFRWITTSERFGRDPVPTGRTSILIGFYSRGLGLTALLEKISVGCENITSSTLSFFYPSYTESILSNARFVDYLSSSIIDSMSGNSL